MTTPMEAEKRVLDSSSPTTIATKRRKIEVPEINVKGNNPKDTSDPKVGASELASAFALASLASLSPGNKATDAKSGDAKKTNHAEEVRNAESFDEARSPKAEAHSASLERHPASPERRAP